MSEHCYIDPSSPEIHAYMRLPLARVNLYFPNYYPHFHSYPAVAAQPCRKWAYDSAHSWRVYSADSLGNQAASTMT